MYKINQIDLSEIDSDTVTKMAYDRRHLDHIRLIVNELLSRRNVPETDFAYVAGIIDGEGCFSVCHGPEPRLNGNSEPSGRLAVIMASEESAKKCYQVTGMGYIAKMTRKTKKGRYMWRWIIYGKQLVAILPRLMPYLLEKKPQAMVMIELYEILSTLDPSVPYTPYQKQELSILKQIMTDLNQ